MLEVGTNLPEAEKQFQGSYEMARAAGSYYAANALSNLGGAFSMAGDCVRADRALDEASRGAESAGDKLFLLRLTINRESVLLEEGKLHAAEVMCRRAGTLIDSGEDKTYLAANLLNLGDVLEWEGDLTGAMESRQKWLSVARETGGEVWKPLAQVGHTLLVQGDIEAARQMLGQAEAEGQKAGSPDVRAEYVNDFVTLALEDGHAADAETIALKAEDRSRERSQPEEAAEAAHSQARGLLAEGKTAAAESAIVRARKYLAGRCAATTNFDLSITAARVKAASCNYRDPICVRDALRTLDGVIAASEEGRLLGVQLDARLARGEILTASGRAAKGRGELASLARQAKGKGYGLVAHEAMRLTRE
jgi:ATP/maltotriose-dependent transcriptional regulator MalT